MFGKRRTFFVYLQKGFWEHMDRNNIIVRIKAMSEAFDKARVVLESYNADKDHGPAALWRLRETIAALGEYQTSGLWKKDFEADEDGSLPKGINRSVLSEDGLYNLLQDYQAAMAGIKKVYFAGSIRGGRSDADLYKRIIEHIQRQHIVLTEHVGDLSLSKTEGLNNQESAIYKQDTDWLKESDIVIAECTTPSLGVGYELAFAEAHDKPVHIFYNSIRTNLSAMLTGNPTFHLHPYTSEAEIYPILDSLL